MRIFIILSVLFTMSGCSAIGSAMRDTGYAMQQQSRSESDTIHCTSFIGGGLINTSCNEL